MGQGRYFAKDENGNLRLFGKPEKEKGDTLTFLINAKKIRQAFEPEKQPLLPRAPKQEQTSCFDCFKFWSKNDSPQSDGDDNEHYIQRARK